MIKKPIIRPEEMETEEQKKIRNKEKIKEKREHPIIAKAMRGWTFTEKAIKDMRRLNEATRKNGKEHGALLCGDHKTLKVDLLNECMGNECSIEIKKLGKCPKEKAEVGMFHTHPGDDKAVLGIRDINYATQFYFDCVGAPEAKKGEDLMCLTLKEKFQKVENSERRINEFELYINNRNLLERYKSIRHPIDIIKEEYHVFNPENYKDP